MPDKRSYTDRYGLKYECTKIEGFRVDYGSKGIVEPKLSLEVKINDNDLEWLRLVVFSGANKPNGKGWSCAEFGTGLRVNQNVAHNIAGIDDLVDEVVSLLKERGREFTEKCIWKSIEKTGVINNM